MSRFDTFLVNLNREIINPLILLLFALAVAIFLFGMLQFFLSAANDEKKTAGKQHMIWGVIGMTIMMGVFFILNLILGTLNISKGEIDPANPGGVNLKEYTPPPFPPQ
ncbi:MAG: hypothetical protein AAB500_02035 [Patescibacteria group bacterium]